MSICKLLLVEDNEGDIFLTREAFEESDITFHITAIRNGAEALEYLFKQGRYQDAPTPDIVMLDINLPRKNGHEVLQALKQNEQTRNLPVIMFTTSSAERDRYKALSRGADAYFTKPSELDELTEIVARIEHLWGHLSEK